MNISKHEHAACTEAPDLQQPNTFCSTEIQQDLGHGNAICEQETHPRVGVRNHAWCVSGEVARAEGRRVEDAAGRRCAMAHAAACAVVLLGKSEDRTQEAGGRKPAGRVVFIAAAADRSVGRRSRRRGRKKRQVEFAPETCGCGEEVVWEIRPGSRRLGTWMRAWAWRRRSVSSGQGFG